MGARDARRAALKYSPGRTPPLIGAAEVLNAVAAAHRPHRPPTRSRASSTVTRSRAAQFISRHQPGDTGPQHDHRAPLPAALAS